MITLKKNNDFFTYSLGKIEIPIEESLIKHLSDDIKIEPDVTFGQFFSIILKHHEEYSEFFSSYLGEVALSDFISEFNKPSVKAKDEDIMDYVCIRWGTTYVFPDEVKKPILITNIPEFIGFQNNQDTFSDGGYALEYTPLNELKKYPFKLIPNHLISDINSTKTILTLDRTFSVFDILTSIFYEITFIGTPTERDAALQKLKQKLNDLDNDRENKMKKYITLEEFLKKMKIDLPDKD